MLREIVEPKSQTYLINIPKEYINKKVEILVLPFSDEKEEELNIFSNHSANTIDEWKDEAEDKIWI